MKQTLGRGHSQRGNSASGGGTRKLGTRTPTLALDACVIEIRVLCLQEVT